MRRLLQPTPHWNAIPKHQLGTHKFISSVRLLALPHLCYCCVPMEALSKVVMFTFAQNHRGVYKNFET